jgi:hypothetical protein
MFPGRTDVLGSQPSRDGLMPTPPILPRSHRSLNLVPRCRPETGQFIETVTVAEVDQVFVPLDRIANVAGPPDLLRAVRAKLRSALIDVF